MQIAENQINMANYFYNCFREGGRVCYRGERIPFWRNNTVIENRPLPWFTFDIDFTGTHTYQQMYLDPKTGKIKYIVVEQALPDVPEDILITINNIDNNKIFSDQDFDILVCDHEDDFPQDDPVFLRGK